MRCTNTSKKRNVFLAITKQTLKNIILLNYVEGKEEGQGEGGWIWQEKTWKGLELRKETKSTGRSGKYFRAVATPNREKPKEEEEEEFELLLH